jgi:membrane-associated phospholipid phosphatase
MRKHLVLFPPHFFSYWTKLFFILFTFALVSYLYFDQPLSAYFFWIINFNGEHDMIGRITDAGDAGNYLILLCGLWIWFVVLLPKIPPLAGWRAKTEGAKNLIIHFLLALMVAGVPTHLLKILVGRQRPHCSQIFDSHVFRHFAFDPHFHSFPSGHSEFVFCVMTVASFRWRKWSEIFFFIAIMISLSRVLLLQHFLSDVAIGAFFGSFGAACAHYLFRDRWPLYPSVKETPPEFEWAR